MRPGHRKPQSNAVCANTTGRRTVIGAGIPQIVRKATPIMDDRCEANRAVNLALAAAPDARPGAGRFRYSGEHPGTGIDIIDG